MNAAILLAAMRCSDGRQSGVSAIIIILRQTAAGL
jgi:hypothetical protein